MLAGERHTHQDIAAVPPAQSHTTVGDSALLTGAIHVPHL